LNGTHQLLVYVDDLNLLKDNINTTRRNREAQIDASKVVCIEVNKKKQRICLCLVTRMQSKITAQLTDPIKMCNTYNIWERQESIKILFMWESKAD
jgi:ribosomal protein L24